MIRITHFRAKCIGCNGCIEAHTDRWRISKKDGKSVLAGGKEKKGIWHFTTFDDEFEANKRASKNCPVKIIKIEKIKPK